METLKRMLDSLPGGWFHAKEPPKEGGSCSLFLGFVPLWVAFCCGNTTEREGGWRGCLRPAGVLKNVSLIKPPSVPLMEPSVAAAASTGEKKKKKKTHQRLQGWRLNSSIFLFGGVASRPPSVGPPSAGPREESVPYQRNQRRLHSSPVF